jgi:MYXO-CTERM domain-containing protein
VNVNCPSGQVCKQGTCNDLCAGVTCPGGGQCINGACTDPTGSGGSSGSAGVGGGFDPGSGGSVSIGGSGNEASSTGGTSGARKPPPVDPSCACRVHSPRTPSLAWLGLIGAAALWTARRRRRC